MTPTYTADQLAAMSGVELSRVCADVIMAGDDRLLNGGAYIRSNISPLINPFRPDDNHNHAAMLRAKMVERWPGGDWWMTEAPGKSAAMFRPHKDAVPHSPEDIGFLFECVDLCHAVCVASVLAAQALGGSGE